MTVKEFEVQLALGSLTYSMKRQLAGGPKTSTRILAKLSENRDRYIRCWVAYNPNAPEEILTKLSKDKDQYVRDCARCSIKSIGLGIREKTPTNN